MEENSRRAKNRHKKRRVWPIIVVILLIIVAGLGVWGYSKVHQTQKAIYQPVDNNQVEQVRRDSAKIEDKDPVSILLLGVDHNSERTEQNSDVMILVTVNPDTKEAKMVSIPLDTPLPGTETKINSAYANNGTSGAINAVQDLLNVPIDYYATVDMEGLIGVVDSLGGVTVDSPLAFSQDGYDFPQGTTEITTGEQALAFVRNRKNDPEGDFGRNRRQRILLLAILDKFSSPTAIMQAGTLFDTVQNYVNTNITGDEMVQLGLHYRLSSDDVEALDLAGQAGTGVSGASLNFVSDEQINNVSQALRENLEINN